MPAPSSTTCKKGPAHQGEKRALAPGSLTRSWDPAPSSVLTHLCPQGTGVGAVASGGSWDLREAKEMGKERVTKDPNTVLPGPGSCGSLSQSRCGMSGSHIEPRSGNQEGWVARSLCRSRTSLPTCKTRDQGSAELCSTPGQGQGNSGFRPRGANSSAGPSTGFLMSFSPHIWGRNQGPELWFGGEQGGHGDLL